MGNAVKPGRKRHILPFEGRDGLQRLQKHLLRHIFGLIPIAYFQNDIAVNLVKLLLIQLGKGFLFVKLRPGYQALLVLHLIPPCVVPD
jgi:hypothetical protein